MIKVISLILVFASTVLGQNNGAMPPWFWPAFPNANGSGPAANGFVCTTESGTSTALFTYQEPTLTTPNQNPIRLNAAGRPVNGGNEVRIYLQPQAYRFTIYGPGTSNSCSGTPVGTMLRQVDGVYDFAQLPTFDNIRLCDRFPGANAGAKIAACISALPATGGTADARGFEGAQSWTADPFSGVTKNVNLEIGSGTTTISANTTVPANVTLGLGQGAILSVSSGITLTVSGTVEASVSQHFAGTGTVSFTSKVKDFYPQWWGALGDGANDDTAALQAAIDAAYGAGVGAFQGAVVVLTPGRFEVTAQIVQREGVIIRGSGRIASSIVADATFPTSTALVLIGHPSEVLTFGARLEDMMLDCSGIAGCIGAESTKINEFSGLYRVWVQDFRSKGVYIHGSAAQNYILDEVHVVAHASVDAAGVGFDINCGGSFFRSLRNFTVIGAGTDFASGIQLDNCVGGYITTGNIETVVNGVLVGPTTGVTGLTVDNINGFGIASTVVIGTAGVNQALTFTNIVRNGGTPYALIDNETATTLTDTSVTLYALGAGSPQTSMKVSDGLVLPTGNGIKVGANSAPAAKLDVVSSNTVPYLRSTPGTGKLVDNRMSSVTTTDATPTVAWTQTLDDNNAFTITATIAARRTNALGIDGAIISGVFYRDGGGGATQVGVTTAIMTSGTYTVIFSTSGNDVRVVVTGGGGQNVSWAVNVNVVQLNASNIKPMFIPEQKFVLHAREYDRSMPAVFRRQEG